MFVPKDAGLCFIKFANHEDIDHAIASVNNLEIAEGDITYTLNVSRVLRS